MRRIDLLTWVIIGLATCVPVSAAARHVRHAKKSHKSPISKVSAQNAIRALRELETVVTTGTTFQDYSTRVVDCSVIVKRNWEKVPAGSLSDDLAHSMGQFIAARDEWRKSIDADSEGTEETRRFLDSIVHYDPHACWSRAIVYLRRAEVDLSKLK